MKKMIIALLAAVAIGAVASEYLGKQFIADPANGTASCTNYYGLSMSSSDQSLVTTNDSKWKIIRTVLDANGQVLELKHAQGTGINPEYSSAWTNRASATYK